MTNTIETKIYLVRHGETRWNACGKQQGHMNSPLTPSGIEQAQLTAKGLFYCGIDVMYSSDLGRAFDTAKIISNTLNIKIHQDIRLRERHLGTMQGMTKAEFKKKYPQEWSGFESGDPDYRFPSGESARQIYERSVACIEELADKNQGKTVLIVTHGGVLSGIFYKAIDIPLTDPRKFSLFNAAINSVTIMNKKWHLDTWGEIGHLHGIKTLDGN